MKIACITIFLFQFFLTSVGLFLFTNIHCQRFVEAFTELPVAGWVSAEHRSAERVTLSLHLPASYVVKQTQRLPARSDLAFESHAIKGRKKIY